MTVDGPNIADVLAAALAQGGELVDVGGFSLDPDKAREKLRDHQLEDPAAYVLLLVEAAWIAGGEGARAGIQFELGSTSTAQFFGLGFDPHELADVLGAVFRSKHKLSGEALARARVLQMLGLAINAALALEQNAVVLHHVDDQGRRTSLRFGAKGPPVIEHGRGESQLLTRIEVHGKALDRRRPERERRLLGERCRYADFPIEVDGRAINTDHRALLELHGERQHAGVAITLGDPPRNVGAATMLARAEPPKLLVLTRGVLSETLTMPNWHPGFVALVDVDLDKDLSQRRVRRDAAFDQVVDAVRRAHERLPKPTHPSPAETKRGGTETIVIRLVAIAALIAVAVVIGLAIRDHEAQQRELHKRQMQLATCDDLASCAEAMRWALDDPKTRPAALEWFESVCMMGEPVACDLYVKHAPNSALPLRAGQRWRGSYECEGRERTIRLDVDTHNPTLGVLHIERAAGAPSSQAVRVFGNRVFEEEVTIRFERWIARPSGLESVNLEGRLRDGRSIVGPGPDGCSDYLLTRE